MRHGNGTRQQSAADSTPLAAGSGSRKNARYLRWFLGGAALWAVAILLLSQHLFLGDSPDNFGRTRQGLNAGLRETLIGLGIRPEVRSVLESRETLGDGDYTWTALNWRIRIAEDFDVPHARSRLQAAVEAAGARPEIRWNRDDREIPLIVEAYVEERLSHRLFFIAPAPATLHAPAQPAALDAAELLGERWQLLTGPRLDLDVDLRAALALAAPNGPPLLVREYWDTSVAHWVVSIDDGANAGDVVETLRRHLPEGSLAVAPPGEHEGEAIVLDISAGGRLSHRLVLTDYPDGRGLGSAGRRDENTILLLPPRAAIIIDDIGFDQEIADQLMGLGVRITLSILPHRPYSMEIALRARSRNFETMLHLPMEPRGYPDSDPGRGAIYTEMASDEIRGRTADNIAAVPYVSGVNNHMGSRATADPRVVNDVLAVVEDRGLYFVDSRTTAETVVFSTARQLDIPTAERTVFLDNEEDADVASCMLRLGELIRVARLRGSAVGIGHPRATTLEAIRRMAGEFSRHGVELVFASEIVSL